MRGCESEGLCPHHLDSGNGSGRLRIGAVILGKPGAQVSTQAGREVAMAGGAWEVEAGVPVGAACVRRGGLGRAAGGGAGALASLHTCWEDEPQSPGN